MAPLIGRGSTLGGDMLRWGRSGKLDEESGRTGDYLVERPLIIERVCWLLCSPDCANMAASLAIPLVPIGPDLGWVRSDYDT